MHETYVNKKKVRVIIPSLNEERLIRRLLSKFNTSFNNRFNIELIVGDGVSQDSTFQIAKEYADKIILHKETFHRTSPREEMKVLKILWGMFLFFKCRHIRKGFVYY